MPQSIDNKLKNAFKTYYDNAVNVQLLEEDILIGEDEEQQMQEQKADVPIDVQQRLLYSIGKEQLVYIYNTVFVKYFSYIQERFFGSKNLQILNAYLFFDKLTVDYIKRSGQRVKEDAVKQLQAIIDLHKAVNDAVQKNNGSVDISPMKSDDDIETIRKKIINNSNVIENLFNAVLAPLAMGYKSLLEQFDKTIGIQYYSRTKYFTSLDDLYKGTQNIFLKEQFDVIFKTYLQVEPHLYGTWYKARFADIIQAINLTVKDIQANKAFNLQVIKNAIKNKNNPIQDVHSNFGKSFEQVADSFSDYNTALLDYISTIDFSDNIYTTRIDKKNIVKELQETDRGFFNQSPIKVANRMINALSQYIQQKGIEREEKDKDVTEKSKNPTSVDDYINYYLGFDKDAEINQLENEYLQIIALTQEYWNRPKAIIEKIGDYKDKEKIRFILKNAVNPVSSLVDLIQKWFVLYAPDELIMYSINKLDFSQLIDKMTEYQDDNELEIDDNKEDSTGIDNLYKLLTSKEYGFFAEQKGHRISWKPNNETVLLLNYIKPEEFIKYLSKKPKEFFDGLFFTNEFYKNLLFADNGKDSYRSIDDIVNADDIKLAAKRLKVSERDTSTGNFREIFREFGLQYTFSQEAQQVVRASSLKVLANNFSAGDIVRGNDKDHVIFVSNIGLMLAKMFNSFIEKYGQKFSIKPELTFREKADILAPMMLRSVGEKYDKSDIKELQESLERIMKLYWIDNYEKLKKNRNPGGNEEMQSNIAKVLALIKKILK